ncbi:MAG TPA: hypothetical protein VLE43_03370 [Candidatus Saccharimonadia bacterium]|nr:hypothetical protein [Candidatus Saccharimonadia bacterium]
MKTWVRWTLGMVAFFAVLITALWWEENWRGRKIWEEAEARVRAAGGPVELKDIVPPPVLDARNVAKAPIFEEAFVHKESSRLFKYMGALSGTNARNAAGQRVRRPPTKPLAREDMSQMEEYRDFLRACLPKEAPPTPMPAADEILHYLKRWDGELREMKEALDRPECRWPFDFERGVFMENPMLAVPASLCFNATPLLLAHAAKGDAAAFTETLITHLRVIRATSINGPHLLGLIAESNGDALLLQSLQHFMPVVPFEEAQLAALQNQIAQITLDNAAQAVRQERVVDTDSLRRVSREQVRFMYQGRKVLPFDHVPEKVQDAARNLWITSISCRPEGWKIADAAVYMRFVFEQVEPCVDLTSGTILRTRVAAMERAGESLRQMPGQHLMLRGMVSAFGSVLLSAAKHQAMASEALLWCAIERFRLKHDHVPDKLEELVPEFVDKLPCDPVNGLPLRYVRQGERDYLLYSIGWNEKDDGGVGAQKREGDWTWASDPRLIKNPYDEKRLADLKAQEERERNQAASKKAKLASKKTPPPSAPPK